VTDAPDKALPPGDEPFLERWSRRKAQAREGIDEEAAVPVADAAGRDPAADAPQPVPELPDIDSLGEDSDYSAFMAPGVDGSVRRDALRKLFASPKFNVRDGLDDYSDDFTQWAPLGDIVTADMRYQVERAAKLAEKMEALAEGQDATAAAAAVPAPPADPAADEAAPETPTDDPERPA